MPVERHELYHKGFSSSMDMHNRADVASDQPLLQNIGYKYDTFINKGDPPDDDDDARS